MVLSRFSAHRLYFWGDAVTLKREDFLRIQRREDPRRDPLWNGMPHITTPPHSPLKPRLNEDCQLFDFLLPYPIQVFDDGIWPALLVNRNDIEVSLLKPAFRPVDLAGGLTVGNERPDLFASVFPAVIPGSSRSYAAKPAKVFSVVADAIRWIRILTRQYWIGTGSTGVSAQYRGSAFRVERREVYQSNFAHYGQAVLASSLDLSVWHTLIQPVEYSIQPPVDQTLFCDALLSLAMQETATATIQLGMAVEIAITNLLDDLAAEQPKSEATRNYRSSYASFRSKLAEHSVAFGLSDPGKYHMEWAPPDWVGHLGVLYEGRGKAAHSGKALVRIKESGQFRPLTFEDLQTFVFSAEALFAWISDERSKHVAGAKIFRPLRIKGIVSGWGKDGEVSFHTSESHGQAPG